MTKIYKPIASIVLEKRRPRTDGFCPVKLRVTLKSEQKYYSLGENLLITDWEKIQNASSSEGKLKDERLKEIRIKLFGSMGHLQKANKLIDQMQFFSFTEFENKFFNKNLANKKTNDVYSFFDSYIEKLNSSNQISTASLYLTAKNSLKSFKVNLRFDELNADLLEKYEKKLKDEGKSSSTIGIYIRNLKTILNLAIEEGIANKDNYPFGRNKFVIPASRNIKKALTIDEIGLIFNYDCEEFGSKDKARDFWLLSYFCNGINIKDICLLKWENIRDGKIGFVRSKTERSKKASQKDIEIMYGEEIKAIVDKWCSNKKGKQDYVFPILEHNLTAKRERELIQYFTKTTNKWMKRIAEDLNITSNLTTYVARHSYSTVLKRSGVSIAYISESLGHKNLKTTEYYLDSFEDSDKINNAKFLTAFSKS